MFCRWRTFVITLIAGWAVSGSLPAQDVIVGTVTKVIDGDTIDVQLTSGPIRVRLHGVDTPERGQPWEDESTAWLKKQVMGREVAIEPYEQDRYERMVGTVYLGDTNINQELVRLGHGWAYRRYLRKADAIFCAEEAEARLARRGLWSLPNSERVAPWEWRRRKTRDSFTDYTRETTANCVASIGD